MKKGIILSLIGFLIILSLYSKESTIIIENKANNEYSPKETIPRDYVPNEETAKRVAEAIWLPIYGEKILEQRPYNVILKDSIWVVGGLMPLPCRNEPGCRGGTAYIEIRKRDCKILKVTHGR